MKMERLHSKQQPTDIMVTIAYAPLGIVGARITMLGHDSIHIDTGTICLHAAHQVEVFFRQADGQLLSLRALTSHRSRHGTRLHFTGADEPRLVTDIQHPLYRAALCQ